MGSSYSRVGGALILSIVFVGLVALLPGFLATDGPAALAGKTSAAVLQPGSSLLFRFDAAAQTFYTYTLPGGSVPTGVVVTGSNPTHVWVTEYGRNQIGHFVFTDTSHVAWTEYPVTSTSNSGPYRIAIAGNSVWFTERGANRVGRLDVTTGQIDEFYDNGLSPDAGLADIQVAPNGWIWATGQATNQLIRLVVTSPGVYAFTSYTDTLLSGPYGLFVESSNSIWFTSPDAHRIGQFTPSTGQFQWPSSSPGFPSNSRPTDIVVTGNQAWYLDFQHDVIDLMQVGTWSVVNSYGPISAPSELVSASPNVFWIAQQSAQGAVGRFIFTSTTSTSLDSFPLPTINLRPTGIALDSVGGVWLSAFMPARIYLPVIVKN